MLFILFDIGHLSFTVTCGSPVNVSSSNHINTGVNVGDTVTYTCDIGFAISGQSGDTEVAICGVDGQWSPVPSCVGESLFSKRNVVLYIITNISS